MRFLLDMPIGQRTARWLASQGHDVVHVRDLGLARAPDRDILQRAAADRRIALTMDLDFPAILAFTHAQRPGTILLRMREPRPEAIHRRLETLLRQHSEATVSSSITVIEDARIRIRSLPIG